MILARDRRPSRPDRSRRAACPAPASPPARPATPASPRRSPPGRARRRPRSDSLRSEQGGDAQHAASAAPGHRRRPGPETSIPVLWIGHASRLQLEGLSRPRSRRIPGGPASRDTSRPTSRARGRTVACGWYGPNAPSRWRLICRVSGSSTARCDPAVAAEPGEARVPVDDPEHRLGRRLDDEEQPDRLVDLDHLPGQARPQVARRAVHHAQQRRDVVRQFRAAAPSGVIDIGEIIFKVDPGADREDGQQDAGQDRLLGVVLRRVVGDEEGPAVEKQAAGRLAVGRRC